MQQGNPHEEPGISPVEFLRLQDELRKTNEELSAANAALRRNEERLEQRVEERTRELATLLRVSHNITTTLELEPLLGLILDQLKQVVDYTLATISILENEDELLVLAARGAGLDTPGTRIPLSEHANTRNMLIQRTPVFVPDLNADTPLAARMRHNIAAQNLSGFGSWMSAPLVFRERSIGVFALAHPDVDYYSTARVELTMAFANQAAVAIENARLYEQARQLAALEERQKLARELHDSVSQALYGIVLGARTARTQLERDPAQATQPLDYILSLSEAALAEMRALIFELRPESLQTDGLVTALSRLGSALAARQQLEVRMDACDEPDVSFEVKESLYRIAQEAMNNIVKHADARHVQVNLSQEHGQLLLLISDDGSGFDMTHRFPGHLGLRSMKERAEKTGGTFEIESAPDSGATIRVRYPISSQPSKIRTS